MKEMVKIIGIVLITFLLFKMAAKVAVYQEIGKYKQSAQNEQPKLSTQPAIEFGSESERLATERLAIGIINSKLPQMIDEVTRADSVSAESDNILVYKFTIIPLSSTDIEWRELEPIYSPNLIYRTCSNYELKKFLEKGKKFSYRLYGNDSKLIGQVLVGYRDCIRG